MRKRQGLTLVPMLVLVLLITYMMTLTAFAAGESYNIKLTGPATAKVGDLAEYTISPEAISAGDGLAAYGGVLEFDSTYLEFVSAGLSSANGAWTGMGNIISPGQLKFMVSDGPDYLNPQSSNINLVVKFSVKTAPNNTQVSFSFSDLEVLDANLDDIPTLNSTGFTTTITETEPPKVDRSVTINKNIDAGGLITGAGNTYKSGDWVAITATPDGDYTFAGWTVVSGGVSVGNNASTGFLMPDNDVVLRANFQGKTRYAVTVNKGTGGDSVTGGGLYLSGETVTLTATALGTHNFTNWTTSSAGVSFADASSDSTTFVMPANTVAVTANFTEKGAGPGPTTHTVSFNANGGSGTMSSVSGVSGSYTLPSCSFTRSGHSFIGWKVNNSGSTMTAGRSITVSSNITLYAQWKDSSGGSGGSGSSGSSSSGGSGAAPTLNPTTNAPTVTQAPSTGSTAFTDITGHWASNYIGVVTERGLFAGTSATTFSPNVPMTRAMFATVLSRLDGADTSGYKSSRFNDIPDGTWYTGGVEWAAENNIVSGIGNSNFAPNTDVTREQMAVMLYKYLEYKGYELPMVSASNSFGDESQISAWAADAVDYMQRAGIITGKPGNLFDPKGVATRAEVATVFAKFIEALEN